MASLKELNIRIKSVKSTQKITSAMKMVAAAKLRRAQESAEAARPYAMRMERMVAAIAESLAGIEGAPRMLAGTGREDTHLIVPCTADRGLCGAFNGSIIREARRLVRELKIAGKTAKILCVGRKGRDGLRREFAADVIDTVQGIGRRGVQFAEARDVAEKITAMFDSGEFDVCTIVFNQFQSAMTQVVTARRLIPFKPERKAEAAEAAPKGPQAIHIFEPEEDELLAALLPVNVSTQVFQALLESAASEHGARMTAMDNATRNAGDMIDNLTLTFNRTRQAEITTELVEIVSGAEAL